jgi:histone acetyltransferase (RNA polymerase elongator complex component)
MHPWIRLNRVVRDIPSTYILGGVDSPDLRAVLQRDMKSRGLTCPCIRCREVGRSTIAFASGAVLCEREYWGSGAREIFLSFESANRSVIFAFLRLRLPTTTEPCLRAETSVNVASDAARAAAAERAADLVFPELAGAALVRELHVYGQLLKADLGPKLTTAKMKGEQSQHRGFGRRLMGRAEQLAAMHGYSRVAVISGVGVRSYYASLGYYGDTGDGKFMLKDLSPVMRMRLVCLAHWSAWNMTRHSSDVRKRLASSDFLLAVAVALCVILAGVLVGTSKPDDR